MPGVGPRRLGGGGGTAVSLQSHSPKLITCPTAEQPWFRGTVNTYAGQACYREKLYWPTVVMRHQLEGGLTDKLNRDGTEIHPGEPGLGFNFGFTPDASAQLMWGVGRSGLGVGLQEQVMVRPRARWCSRPPPSSRERERHCIGDWGFEFLWFIDSLHRAPSAAGPKLAVKRPSSLSLTRIHTGRYRT